MALRLSLLCLVIWCASACSTPATREQAVHPGYARGVALANEEIRRGEASIYVFGLVTPPGSDRETGLPYRSAGCVLSDDIAEFIRGHNEAIRAHLLREVKRE